MRLLLRDGNRAADAQNSGNSEGERSPLQAGEDIKRGLIVQDGSSTR